MNLSLLSTPIFLYTYTKYFHLSVLNFSMFKTNDVYNLCCDVFFNNKSKTKIEQKYWKPQNGSCQLKRYIFIINAMWIGSPRELENFLVMLLSILNECTTNIYRRYCQKNSFRVEKSFNFFFLITKGQGFTPSR